MSLWGVESNRSVGSKQGQISARYKIAQIFQKVANTELEQ